MILILSSCEETMKAPEVSEPLKLTWMGFSDTVPTPLGLYSVYYDLNLKCTRIFTGYEWEIMAKGGFDAQGISWLGERDTFPPNAFENSTFYHTVHRVSYILTANGWDTLAISGKDALTISHIGPSPTEPLTANINDIYYNTVEKVNYIYTEDGWKIYSMDGLDGIALIWLGTLAEVPENPLPNTAYYDENQEKSFIFDGIDWYVLSVDGIQGKAGETINWLGELDSFPKMPNMHEAFLHKTSGNSYIFDGKEWSVFSTAGRDGIGIVWLGTLPEEPAEAVLNGAYQNLTDGNCYIFDGEEWSIMSVGGKAGEDGLHGYSVIWKGELTHAPDPAVENWAYYSVYEGCSYIFKDSTWEILIPSPVDGITLNWRGELSSAPLNPKDYDAYFDTNKKESYFFLSGSHAKWLVLCGATGDGSDGGSVIWKGNLPYAPSNPETNWVYRNTDSGNIYQYMMKYYNYRWYLIGRSSSDGVNGKTNFTQLNQVVASGDTVIFAPNLTSSDIFFDAKYYRADSTIHEFSFPDPAWRNGYTNNAGRVFYSNGEFSNSSKLEPLRDNKYFSLYLDTTDNLWGTVYDSEGVVSVDEQQIASNVYGNHDVIELNDGTVLVTYLTQDSKFEAKKGNNDGVFDSSWTISTNCTMVKSVKRTNGAVSFLYLRNDSLLFTSVSVLGDVSTEQLVVDSASRFEGLERNRGTLNLIVSRTGTDKVVVVDSEDNVTLSDSRWLYPNYKFIELTNGRLYSLRKYVYGYKGSIRTIALSELDESFNYINTYSFDHHNIHSDIIALENNSIGLAYCDEPEYDYNDSLITPAKTLIRVLNPEFELESNTVVNENYAGLKLAKHSDASILSAGYSRSYSTNRLTMNLTKNSGKPKVELRQLNNSEACIINNSGRDIKVSVGAYCKN